MSQDPDTLRAALIAIEQRIEPIARKTAERIYEDLLATLQDHLVQNAEFNIGETIDSARRTARLERERAEALLSRLDRYEKPSYAFLEAIARRFQDGPGRIPWDRLNQGQRDALIGTAVYALEDARTTLQKDPANAE